MRKGLIKIFDAFFPSSDLRIGLIRGHLFPSLLFSSSSLAFSLAKVGMKSFLFNLSIKSCKPLLVIILSQHKIKIIVNFILLSSWEIICGVLFLEQYSIFFILLNLHVTKRWNRILIQLMIEKENPNDGGTFLDSSSS